MGQWIPPSHISWPHWSHLLSYCQQLEEINLTKKYSNRFGALEFLSRFSSSHIMLFISYFISCTFSFLFLEDFLFLIPFFHIIWQPDISFFFFIDLEPFTLAPLIPNLYFLSCSFSSSSSSYLFHPQFLLVENFSHYLL